MKALIEKIKQFFRRLATLDQRILDAQRLGKKRRLIEADEQAEGIILELREMSWWIRLVFDLKYPSRRLELESQQTQWRQDLVQARGLQRKALALSSDISSDEPDETTGLSRLVYLLEQSLQLLDDVDTASLYEQKKAELKNRQVFTAYLEKAKVLVVSLYYKEALQEATQAHAYIASAKTEAIIQTCKNNLQRQSIYESILSSSRHLVSTGHLQPAIAQLKRAQELYPRTDGQQELSNYERRCTGESFFKAGLAKELSGQWAEAAKAYQKSLQYQPDHTICRIRLAISQIQLGDIKDALTILNQCTGSDATYLKGFAHYVQGNLVDAYQSWHSIPQDADVEKQKNTLQRIREQQKLSMIAKIEQNVKADDLETAYILSQDFVSEYGFHENVEKNLTHHIKPRLVHHLWKNGSLETLLSHCQSEWNQKRDLLSLHNLAVAAYYQAKQDPYQIARLIPVWSSIIINLKEDPILDNIPWISTPIHHDEIAESLKDLAEQLIYPLQENDVQTYLAARDLMRWEFMALDLLNQQRLVPPSVGNLKLSPALYLQIQSSPSQKLYAQTNSGKILDALYSPWGKCLAAFLDGDPNRGMFIKPNHQPHHPREHCAVHMIAYYEGSNWLKENQWRQAKPLLTLAKPEIQNQSEWKKTLDTLFEESHQNLSDLDSKIEFSQFWYDLLSSSKARGYLVEHKSVQIAQKIDDKLLSHQAALRELNKLKTLESSHATLNEIITVVEVQIDLEEINSYFKRNDIEGMVAIAKRSNHQKVRFIVAEILIDIVINASQKGADPAQLRLIASLAHELCPHEPAFQSIFYTFGLKRGFF